MTKQPSIGVVGLGIMGGAMAETLLAHGYAVAGYDVAEAARKRLRRAGGTAHVSSTAVAARSDVIITSLATSAALRDAAEKIAATNRPRCRIVIETSTLPLADKEAAMRRLKRARIATLDCPISGTAVRMKEGVWTIFASGDERAFRQVEPLLEVFTARVPYCGVYGNGTKLKYAANHLVAILNVATAESITFGRKMGLQPRQLLELFGPSPIIGTGVYRLRGAMMAARKYRPPTMKVEVWQKDMQVIGDMAKAVDCPTPLFTACVPLFNAAMAQGLAQSDTASVCEVLGMIAGVDGPRVRHR
ncbi:MAG: NAD(P)-dependent oxidoreductase [Betaproteobacteria bacterium]|nr:NAD(P)-dependent oxidoreductase [Betaproteobacteria bacterium]